MFLSKRRLSYLEFKVMKFPRQHLLRLIMENFQQCLENLFSMTSKNNDCICQITFTIGINVSLNLIDQKSDFSRLKRKELLKSVGQHKRSQNYLDQGITKLTKKKEIDAFRLILETGTTCRMKRSVKDCKALCTITTLKNTNLVMILLVQK